MARPPTASEAIKLAPPLKDGTGVLTGEKFDQIVRPEKMTGPMEMIDVEIRCGRSKSERRCYRWELRVTGFRNDFESPKAPLAERAEAETTPPGGTGIPPGGREIVPTRGTILLLA